MALASTVLLGAAPPRSTDYVVTPVRDGRAMAALQVTVTFDASPGGTTGFGWDSQWAGETRLWQWACDVSFSGATVVRADRPGHWEIGAAPGTRLTVRYRIVSAVDRDPALRTFEQAWPVIRPRWFFAMGSAVFARPDDRGGSPATFSWDGPADLPFASDLQHLNVAKWPNRPGTIDDVLESVLIGGPDVRVTDTGSGVRVASVGDGQINERLGVLARRVVGAERRFWGAHAAPYLVAASPLAVDEGQAGFAGTNRGDGFALWLAPNTSDDDLALLLSHEYFHSWNPARLGGSDADPRRPGASYWFSEGFTDFYSLRLMARAGVLSPDAFVKAWNADLTAYAASPVRTMPGAEAGRRFFESDEIQKLAYQRGSLLAARWNARLLAVSRGRTSLDSILHAQAAAARRSSLSAVSLFRRLMRRHGVDVDDDIRTFIDEGRPIILAPDTFGPCLLVDEALRPVFDRGYDAATTSEAGNVARGVDPASNAYAAGLRDGMRILARREGRTGEPDQPFVLDIDDRGTRRTIRYLPQRRERVATMALRLSSHDGQRCTTKEGGLVLP